MEIDDRLVRTLEELRILYDLHPGVRDVVVEGSDDANVIRVLLEKWGLSASVFAVHERVKIEPDLVRAIPHDVNTRGEVIALALAASSWGSNSLTCIVDADFEILTGPQVDVDCLLTTDHGSMESYALCPRSSAKFARLHLKDRPESVNWDQTVKAALTVVYAVRLELKKRNIGLVTRFVRGIKVEGGLAVVDVDDLLKRSGIADVGERAEIAAAVELHLTVLRESPRFAVRGHDIAPTVRALFGLRQASATDEVIESFLRASISASEAQDQPMFAALRDRVAA